MSIATDARSSDTLGITKPDLHCLTRESASASSLPDSGNGTPSPCGSKPESPYPGTGRGAGEGRGASCPSLTCSLDTGSQTPKSQIPGTPRGEAGRAGSLAVHIYPFPACAELRQVNARGARRPALRHRGPKPREDPHSSTYARAGPGSPTANNGAGYCPGHCHGPRRSSGLRIAERDPYYLTSGYGIRGSVVPPRLPQSIRRGDRPPPGSQSTSASRIPKSLTPIPLIPGGRGEGRLAACPLLLISNRF
jgi:hypothetical protein